MLAHKVSGFVLILLFCFVSVSHAAETASLFSPATADSFREKAVDLYTEPNATAADARQAVVFLDAVDSLDRKAEHTLPNMIRLAWRFPSVDVHQQVENLFFKYAANDDADLEVLRLSTQYLLEPLSAREEREEFFNRILRVIGSRHKVLASDVLTQLGLMAAERSDMQAATYYLMQAANNNVYNKLAFQKLMELVPKQISPATYIQHLRLVVRENPYDIDAAYAFANSLYNVGLYEFSGSAYRYCGDLFASLHPKDPLPPAIYLPWALSNYNDPRNLKECASIAQKIEKNGVFDLYLEAIVGNAAIKLGNADEGAKILQKAAQKGIGLISAGRVKAHDIAWFYCFAEPDADKALEWANKANASEPNLPRTASILAYALVMNGQQEIARPLVERNYKTDQISALAMGQIQLIKDANAAIETIKAAISLDAGSLEAQRGKELVAQKGSTYVPIYETAVIVKNLQLDFGDEIVRKFMPAGKLIAVKLTASGNEFPYGGHFNASLAISNNAEDPLVISDGCLFKGNIRVDALVKGDLNERIPNLVIQKIRPSEPVEARQSFFVPLHLIQGRLEQLLREHPQASVEIEFTTWLDPVADPNGAVHNALAGVEPARMSVTRNGIDVSGAYLQTRLSSLARGQAGQKIKTAELFAGLLLEQKVTAGSKPYKMTYVDAQLLRAGLARCLTDENWDLRVETMLMLGGLPLNYNLIDAVSENLNSELWPVRMSALWLLGKEDDPGFRKVRDWTAKNDNNKLVLEMASALGATVSPELLAKTSGVAESKPPSAEPNIPSSRPSPLNAGATAPEKAQLPEKIVVPEPNQPAKPTVAEQNQVPKAVLTEPNLPPKAAPIEPNKPQKKKSEPNDIIEEILKS